MKFSTTLNKTLISLLLILFFNVSFGQINIINKTLVSPDSSILYIGIPNAIEIINVKDPFFEIRAASRGLTSTNNPYVFELHPSMPGWDTIYILNGDEVVFKKPFKIIMVPQVQAKLGTLRTDTATSEEITINGWIVLTIPNCKCKPNFEVTSFEVEFDSEEINEDIMPIDGDRLTTKARKIIRSMKPGDVVYFDNIVARNEEGRSVKVPGFSVTVKE